MANRTGESVNARFKAMMNRKAAILAVLVRFLIPGFFYSAGS